MTSFRAFVAAALVGFTGIGSAQADEGMWLLEKPPLGLLKERHGFVPPPGWLEHLQKSCVKMGASGSLVSADGLVMTNHHVGADQLFKLSTPQRDLLRDGFYARTREAELRCPDLEVKILWSTQDVTDRVNAAVEPGMPAAAAYEARRRAMTRIEQASKDETGLHSEVITLWHGARYHLYRYRKYDDVRLVMAPEKWAAVFGGDIDNFEFPRYDLDFCFFRIYEQGKPLRPEHYLRLSRRGAAEGELQFVLGHPGRTRRLLTVDHLKFLRDVDMPQTLSWLWRREVQLTTFSEDDPEQARIAEDDLFGVQNARKARSGYYRAMLDPAFMQNKTQAEARLRAAAETKRPWERIAAAQREYRTFFLRHDTLREGRPFDSVLFDMARTIVRLAAELPKPSAQRLREYRDSELESLYLRLYSPAPIYDALEVNGMLSGLSLLAERLGAEDPATLTAFDAQSPRSRAEQLVRECTLRDIGTRRRLVEEGAQAVAASRDPMIRLAAALDEESRALRKRYEDDVEGVERENYAKIAAAQFQVYGEALYPDATRTLRLAFGPVKGYRQEGAYIPPLTTLAGLYARWKERGPQPPFFLPPRWIGRKDRLDLETPANFVLTADIIGGNSGSPVVDRSGEVTGLVFDGNIASLAWDVAYEDEQGRAIAVDVRGIIETLRNVYDAKELVDELMGG